MQTLVVNGGRKRRAPARKRSVARRANPKRPAAKRRRTTRRRRKNPDMKQLVKSTLIMTAGGIAGAVAEKYVSPHVTGFLGPSAPRIGIATMVIGAAAGAALSSVSGAFGIGFGAAYAGQGGGYLIDHFTADPQQGASGLGRIVSGSAYALNGGARNLLGAGASVVQRQRALRSVV